MNCFVVFVIGLTSVVTALNVNSTVTLKVSTLESFFGGNPNNVAGQAIWNSVLTDSGYYDQNTITMRLCCENCNYLKSVKFTLGDFSQTNDFIYSEFNATTLCINAYSTLTGTVPPSPVNNTVIYAIDDRGSAYVRLHTNAIQQVDELVEITDIPPEIQGVPPPPTPETFTIEQFKTLYVNDTHTTIGFIDNSTHNFELFYGLGNQTTHENKSSFTVSFVDIFTTFLAIRSYTTNIVGDILYSNWTRVYVPAKPDITKFPALTTDATYQGIVVDTDSSVMAYRWHDFNIVFYRDNITTTAERVVWGTAYHNSYLNGPSNTTNFTFKVQATSAYNPLLLSQWSDYANQSSVVYWKDTPAPQVWLEFENNSFYDWFNNDASAAYVNNATLAFKHTQDPDEYRMNGHLYSISNGTDLIVHTLNGALSNWTWSIVFWTYIESNSTTYTILNTTYGDIRVENGSINWHVAFFSDKTYPITGNSSAMALNRWYQLGIEYDDHFGHMGIYINGQYSGVYTNLPDHISQITPRHFNVTIVNGPIDNLVIFTNQTLGPLYMAALYEFYGFPYLSSFNVNVSNSTQYVYAIPPIPTCPSGSFYNNSLFSCQVCSPGYYQNVTGSTSTSCMGCPAGTFASSSNSTSCVSCPVGRYQSSVNSTDCIDCSTGNYQPQTGATSCINCAAGTYQNLTSSTSCILCAAGTYQDLIQSTSCLECPSGSYQNNTGSTICITCLAGSSGGGAIPCESCSPGTYQANSSSSTCTSCSPGYFQGSSGATSCSSCSAGTYSSSNGSTSCASCNPGFYQSSSSSTSCNSCPSGSFTNTSSSTSCTSCSSGSFSSQTNSTSCTSCSAGTFSSSTGSTGCNSCIAGKYANTTGNTQCTDCAINTFSNTTGLTQCYNCPYATQSTAPGSTSCTNIVPGAVTGFTNSKQSPDTLTWNSVTYANIYSLQYNGNPVATTSSLIYTIPSYSADTVYSTTIQVTTVQGASGPVVYQTIPARPASVSYTIDRTTNTINTTWTQGTNTLSTITNWILYWAYNSTSNPTTTQLVSPSTTYYVWTNVTTSTTVYWWMQAVSINGTYSGNTTIQSVTAYAPVPTDVLFQLKLTSDMRDTSLTNWRTTTQGSTAITFTTVGGIQSSTISCSALATYQAVTASSLPMPISWTVAVWYYFVGGNSGYIIWGNTGNSGSTTTTANAFVLTKDAIYMVSDTNSYLFTLALPTWTVSSTWVHATVTYDATTATLSMYANGILIASASDSRFINNWVSGLHFTLASQSTTTRPMCGNYYDLYIYSRVLSQTEMLALMNVPLAAIYSPAGCVLSLASSITSVNATVSTTPSTNLNYTTTQTILLPTGTDAQIHDFVCPSGTATTEDTVGYTYQYVCTQDSVTKSYRFSTVNQHCYPSLSSSCYVASVIQAGTGSVNVSCEANPLTTPALSAPQVQITFEGQMTDTSTNAYPLTANNGFALGYDGSRGASGYMSTGNTKRNLQVGGGFILGSSYTIMGYVNYNKNTAPNSAKAVIWGNIGSSGATSTLDNSFYLTTNVNAVQAGQYVSGTLLSVNGAATDYTDTTAIWWHYTVTFDKTTGTLTIFRDGQRYSSGTTTSKATSATHQSSFVGGLGIQLGCDTTASSLVGGVDHFKVWNTVLTDAQIHREWKNTVKPITPTSLPSLLAVTSIYNTIGVPSVVQWTPPVPQNGDYYNVTYSAYSGASTLVTSTTSISTVNTASTSVTLPTYNPDYWYTVNVASASYYGTSGSVVTGIVPSRPTSVTASPVNFTAITFTWTAQYTGTIVGYYLYATGAINSIVTTGPSTTSYTFGSLASGSTVNLVIQTIGVSSLTFSGNTTVVSATTPVPLPSPTLSVAFEGGFMDNSTSTRVYDESQGNNPTLTIDTRMGQVGVFSYTAYGWHQQGIAYAYALPASYSYSVWVYVDPLTITNVIDTQGRQPNLLGAKFSDGVGSGFTAGDWYLGITSAHQLQAGQYVNSGGSTLFTVTVTSETVPTSTWNQYTVTYSSSTGVMNIYRDSVLKATGTADAAQKAAWGTQTPDPTMGGISVGCFGGGCYAFNGYLDQVQVYNSALTLSQVQADYQNGLKPASPTITAPILYIGTTNEKAASSTSQTDVWKDFSGNNYATTASSGQASVVSISSLGWTTASRTGMALSAGASGYGTAYPYGASLTMPTSYTISVWVSNWANPSKLFCDMGCAKLFPDVVAQSFYFGQLNTNQVVAGNYATDEVRVTDPNDFSTYNAGSVLAWMHYVVTYDAPSGAMVMYRNGISVSTATATSGHIAAWTGGTQVQFGIAGGGGAALGFCGAISDFQLYNYALSATQAGMLYRYSTTSS